jgi:hypothetical protein
MNTRAPAIIVDPTSFNQSSTQSGGCQQDPYEYPSRLHANISAKFLRNSNISGAPSGMHDKDQEGGRSYENPMASQGFVFLPRPHNAL